MKKYARRNLLMDRFHKGFVITCLTVTIGGTLLLGGRFLNYFLVIKPRLDKEALLAKEELLSEGAYKAVMEDSYDKIRN